MTDYIVPPPPSLKAVALTRGADCRFVLRRKDVDGNAVDWDADVYVWIDGAKSIDTPTQVTATVTDAADAIKDGTAWRAVMSVAGTTSTEKPLMVGYFERFDGGKSK